MVYTINFSQLLIYQNSKKKKKKKKKKHHRNVSQVPYDPSVTHKDM